MTENTEYIVKTYIGKKCLRCGYDISYDIGYQTHYSIHECTTNILFEHLPRQTELLESIVNILNKGIHDMKNT